MDVTEFTPATLSYHTLNPPAPSPEKSPDQYTSEKIQVRLEYAQRMIKRDITPRSALFIQLYKDTAKGALDEDNEALREYCCAQLFRYDQYIQMNSFLCLEASKTHRELETKLLKLKRLEYFNRYGDYLARELGSLREAATKLKTENHGALKQYWTEINRRLQGERGIQELYGGSINGKDIPTLVAVRAVAIANKLDTDRVEWMIGQYAERNSNSHSTITELIQAGRYRDLSEVLYHDAKDLAMMIPPKMEKDIAAMESIIASLRDAFFIINEGEEENWQAWEINKEAKEFRKGLGSAAEERERQKRKHVEDTVALANKAIQRMEKQKEITAKAVLGKRKESYSFPLDEKVLKRKNIEMEKVIGIQKQVEAKEEEIEGKIEEVKKMEKTLISLYDKRHDAVGEFGNPEISDREDASVNSDEEKDDSVNADKRET
jgi:hypothetical protein